MAGTGNHVMMLLTLAIVMLYTSSYAQQHGKELHTDKGIHIRMIVNIGRRVHKSSDLYSRRGLGPRLPGARYCTQARTNKQPRDCRDAVDNGCQGKAVTWIKPRGTTGFWAYCDGPWTVIQRRWEGGVNFYRPWKDYVRGFPRAQQGKLDPRHDFWVGNDNLHALTSQRKVKLKVELWKQKAHMAQKNAYKYEEYLHFAVGNRKHKYKLQISLPSGTAGDCLYQHNKMYFSTYDRDHDTHPKLNCAKYYKGAWWYSACFHSNLNGMAKNGITWSCSHGWKYSVRDVMKIY